MNRLFSIIRNLLAIIGLLSLLIIPIYFLLNTPIFENTTKEDFRISSPGRIIDAIVVKYEPTSFTTPVYSLHLKTEGTKFNEKGKGFVFPSYGSTGIKRRDISWLNDSTLVIHRYESASIRIFENFCYVYKSEEPSPDESPIAKVSLILKNY